MFGQIGELKKMYDKYKKLQDALKNVIVRAKDNSENPIVMIDISAEMKLKEVQIVDESYLSPEKKSQLEAAIKTAFEKGQQKAQEIAQEKTKDILGFDPSNLANMMGGGAMPNIPGLTG
ncbi:MAG TPA: YbaB/EbfC family nucleoid-associated protein [Candidatus Absconditabacterales bacterium]|nr:YbaB/EbfC family nucleoid-associated protein [Candidatus Absconditabacterales bacterium]